MLNLIREEALKLVHDKQKLKFIAGAGVTGLALRFIFNAGVKSGTANTLNSLIKKDKIK